MAASYPTSVKSFSPTVNGITKFVAALFNTAYEEITATQTSLMVCLNTDGKVISTGLNTATVEVSTAANTPVISVLTGSGQYGFWPQTKAATPGGTATVAVWFTNTGTMPNAFITTVAFFNDSYTMYVIQRYVTASGKDMWIFLLIDKITKEILGAYAAPDAPHYGNGGEYNKVPHPFLNYDETKHEIILLDKETVNLIKSQVTAERSILTIINEDTKIDYTKEKIYEPLHSGKFLTIDKDGKQMQVEEMIATIAPYIKVKGLKLLTQADKNERKIICQQRIQEAKNKKDIEDLIEAKKRELAIAELKKEGKVN